MLNEKHRATTPRKLTAIAADLDMTVDELVPRVVEEEGSLLRAAMRLGVVPNTIRYHMKRLGYVPRYQGAVAWEKPEGAQS